MFHPQEALTRSARGERWRRFRAFRSPSSRYLLAVVVLATVFASMPRVLEAPLGQSPPVWRDRYTGMRFVLLGPGTFDMGTPIDEPHREARERLHRVTLPQPFYMAVHEVTQGEWERVMGQNPSRFQDCGLRCPVENVNWFEAQQFVRLLNAKSQPGFRLPTEAEWEFACRAGGTQPFGHSSTLTAAEANIAADSSSGGPAGAFPARPMPVGRFPANAWGLFDMSGNVWEWTEDWSCPYPADAEVNPLGRCGSETRVVRGGSWLVNGASARCGLRYSQRPDDRGPSVGVRLVKEVK